MTTEPLFITPDDDLKDAVEMLIEQKFGAIPVVNEAEGLVRIVSYVDVLRRLSRTATGGRDMKNGKEGVVREIMMGSPVTLKPEDTSDLANDIISLGRIRHIPIVDGIRLVGIVTGRDLIGTAAAQIFGLKRKSKSALLKSVLIKEVMKKRVITAAPDTPIKDIAQTMADKKIGCVPVLSDGIVVGLVTTTDILRYVESLA